MSLQKEHTERASSPSTDSDCNGQEAQRGDAQGRLVQKAYGRGVPPCKIEFDSCFVCSSCLLERLNIWGIWGEREGLSFGYPVLKSPLAVVLILDSQGRSTVF